MAYFMLIWSVVYEREKEMKSTIFGIVFVPFLLVKQRVSDQYSHIDWGTEYV